jgi:glycyl-tRNA synthetase beta chain
MRWGDASASTETLGPPAAGIVALLGEEIVPFEISWHRGSAAALDHRYHPYQITIGGARLCREAACLPRRHRRSDERATLIRDRAREAALHRPR